MADYCGPFYVKTKDGYKYSDMCKECAFGDEADELEDGQEYLIHSDEMFLENEIPFFEKVNIDDWQEDDELPF